MRLSDINPKSIEHLFSSASRVYEGADSFVVKAGNYCVHRYKAHVDTKLFDLYLAATEQSRHTLNRTYKLDCLAVPLIMEVAPILTSFVSDEGQVCSATEWIDWQRGDELKKDHNFSHIVIAAIELANSNLRYPNTQIMGIEVTAQNTRYLINTNSIRCKVTDVGNSLRYLYTSSRWWINGVSLLILLWYK